MAQTFAPCTIAMENVGLRLGGRDAVRDLCFEVGAGELCCLLGPSGCGKTTSLRLVAGLETPDEGRVLIGGRDATRMPPRDRGLGFVFQDYALFPHLSVFNNVAYGLRCRGAGGEAVRTEVEQALETVRLGGYGPRRVHELSGGERQRVALARSLVTRPGALLLDEPFSNLDAALRQAMRTETLALHRELGLTMVFVTHDQQEAMAMADRILLMRSGRLVQEGTPRDLYERPGSLFAAGFLGRANILPPGHPLRRGIKGGPDTRAVLRPERVILSADGQGEPGRVLEAVYLGAGVQYQVRLDAAPDPVLEAERPAHEPVFAPGDRVLATAPAEALALVPGDA